MKQNIVDLVNSSFAESYTSNVKFNFKKLSVLPMSIILVCTFGLTSSHADSGIFSNISEIDQEIFYIGDILEIQTSMCFSSKKPSEKSAKVRLQVYLGTSWRNVGTTKFVKSNANCGNKKPYLQIFEWEVDQLGANSDGRGILRLRDSTTKPSTYAQAFIFESESSAIKWKQNRAYEADLGFRCLISGGQWDSTRKICLGGSEGL